MTLRLRLGLVAAALLPAAGPVRADQPPAAPTIGIAILEAAAWSSRDPAREGAGEFEVLLRIAQLRRAHRLAALVSVGDRNGVRRSGGEKALTHAALTGLPVVRLAPGGAVAPTPWAIFLDGGQLGAGVAGRIVRSCLERHGAPPAAADPAQPTDREIAAIHGHLRSFQSALDAASAAAVARVAQR